MSKICVVGTGYVGLVTGTCFADLGNDVTCLDIDNERISNLKAGIMPIYEPGLEQLVKHNVSAERLVFTTSYEEALDGAEYAFIAVGTPSGNAQQPKPSPTTSKTRSLSSTNPLYRSAPVIGWRT